MALFLLATAAMAAEPYVSEGFVEIPGAVRLGAMSAVDVDAKGNVYILHRGEPPLLAFNDKGKMVNAFGDGMFQVAHGLRVGPDGNIWTTDNGRHVIRKFSPQGELLATYGLESTPGAGETLFRSPDDLVFASNGDIYVADAGNGRIVHLKADGSYVGEWGKKGKGESEFAAAHGIAIDKQDRIYVADRGNNRIQVFSPEGKFLGAWGGFGNPFGALVVGDVLLVSDGDANKINHLSLKDGKLVAQWGDAQTLQLPHLMATAADGRLFVAEVNGNRVQIFRRVK
ncbi:MAG: peptidyl-alpha-hydroxyglycine alpha-amidating lyase family protein [Bryobacterales bacterium]